MVMGKGRRMIIVDSLFSFSFAANSIYHFSHCVEHVCVREKDSALLRSADMHYSYSKYFDSTF